MTTRRTTSALTGRSAIRTATDVAFSERGACHHAGARSTTASPRTRWSRGRRLATMRPRVDRVHALHDQPEPARHSPSDGRVRAQPAGAQAPRGRARCRRRLRLEDLSLRRGSVSSPGLRSRSAARSNGPSDRSESVYLRRSGPGSRDEGRACASMRTVSLSACVVDTFANLGAYLSTFAPCNPNLAARHACLRASIHHPGDPSCGCGRCSPTPCPSTPIAAPAVRKPHIILERIIEQGGAGRLGLEPGRSCGGETSSRSMSSHMQTPVAVTYDTGDYEATLAKVDGRSPTYAGFASRRAASEAQRQTARHGPFLLYRSLRHRPFGACRAQLGARAGLYRSGERFG